jgi:hypothetical protein
VSQTIDELGELLASLDQLLGDDYVTSLELIGQLPPEGLREFVPLVPAWASLARRMRVVAAADALRLSFGEAGLALSRLEKNVRAASTSPASKL